MLAAKALKRVLQEIPFNNLLDKSWIVSITIAIAATFLHLFDFNFPLGYTLLLVIAHQASCQFLIFLDKKGLIKETLLLSSILHLEFVSLLAAFTGGALSPFNIFYLFLISFFALSQKIKETTIVSVLAIVLFTISSLLANKFFNNFDFWVFIFAFFFGFVSIIVLTILAKVEIGNLKNSNTLIKDLRHDLKKRQKELIYIDKLLRKLNASHDSDAMLNTFSNELLELISCKGILIFLKNNKDDIFYCKSKAGVIDNSLISTKLVESEGTLLEDVSSLKKSLVLLKGEVELLSPSLNKEAKVQNILVTPLLKSEEVIGLVCCLNKEGSFDDSDLKFMNMISHHAAVLINNTMLIEQVNYLNLEVENSNSWFKKSRKAFTNILEDINNANEKLEDALHQTLSMYKIAVELSKSLNERQVLEAILTNSVDLIKAKRGSLVLTKGQKFEQVVNYNYKSNLRFSLQKNPVRWIKENKKPLIINDFKRTAFQGYNRLAKINNLLAVPLVQGDRCMGVLCLFDKNKGFSREDAQNLVTLARQATVTMLNARIYENEKKTIKKLKELDKMKADFIASVSHELRSPLTTIKGYLDLVMEGEAGAVNKEQLEFLSIVDRSSERLLNLITDLLTISKIEASGLKINKKEISLDKVLNRVTKLMKPEASKKEIDIKVELERNMPLINADPNRLEQVVINLLSNAIKFTPQGGVIRVASKMKDDKLLVLVKDSGFGISKEDQKQLFDKFFRSQKAITKNISGTGLGLAIAKGIIEQHHGKIWVESQLKKGSTFYFTLPIYKKKVA